MMVSLKLLGALGLLIYGMRMMSDALQKMAGPQLRHILARMTTNRLTGMLTGTFVTCAVQSSSAAVMAITILLCSTGVLPIYLGIALVMGENIGTTATANLAALGAGTEARRAALAHLLFNVFGVVWVLCVFYPFVNMVCSIVGYDPTMGGQTKRLPVVLAMFHTCFNVTNTALLIGLIPQMERVVCWLLPKKEQPQQEEFRLQYIQGNLMQTPEISILQAQKETARFAESVQRMFGMVRQLVVEKDDDKFVHLFSQIEHQEDFTDRMEIEIARFLEQVSDNHLSDDTKAKVRQMMREVGELESIGDACYNLARTLNRRMDFGKDFTPRQYQQLGELMELCDNAMTQMCTIMTGHRHEHNINETFRLENEINLKRQHLKSDNIRAVDEHEYDYIVGTMYIDLINECEKLGDYVVNVVQARFGKQ